MSGIDPLAALAADAALAQSSVGAIDLGVALEILQQQIAVGDLLTATVLPAQGGVDRLALLGQTLIAQLPPGIDPGETLLLQVSGFSGNQILVRNLGVVDPNNLPPTIQISIPPGPPQQATLTTILTPGNLPLPAAATPAQPAAPNAPPAETQYPVQASITEPATLAPPRAVFVAASVQPAPPQGAGSQPVAAANVLPPELAAALGIEARIAATRAASVDITELVVPGSRPVVGQSPVTIAPAVPRAIPEHAAPAWESAPPPILPAGSRNLALPPVPALPPPTPEAALLSRLRIPFSPLTEAAAKIANHAASLLPRALARLDAALARIENPNATVLTLRAIAAFVRRIDPSNERALPEQLMAYVNNVVGASESKLAAIVRAFVALETRREDGSAEVPPAVVADDELPLPGAPPQSAPSPFAQGFPVAQSRPPFPAPSESDAVAQQQASPQQQQAPSVPPRGDQAAAAQPEVAPAPAAVQAHIAERVVALQYDLKAAVTALVDSPPRNAPADLAPALSEVLTAVTGVQINALNQQTLDPSTIAIPLPVFFHENGRPVQLRISRDAPNGGRFDPDNFHIAFVLDTKSLGTVAVDLQTSGRAVNVSVKTEASRAASRFNDTLSELRGRLEQLHYRVAGITAAVASRLSPNEAPAMEEVGVADSSSNLDFRA